MPTLYAEIDINAPQSVVWEALTRKDQWRFWNTFLYDCDPSLQIVRGGEIFLSMQRLEGDEETEFQPVITMLRPPYMMRWISTIPGLRCEHVFELRETVPGCTRYIHREIFSGILSKVFLPFIRQDERQGLRRMSQQLKMHVENSILGYSNQPDYRDQPSAQRNYDYSARGSYDNRSYSNRSYDSRNYNNRDYNKEYYNRNYDNQSYDDGRYDDGYSDRGYDDRGGRDYPRDYDSRPRRRR
jgi:hypothetical protein